MGGRDDRLRVRVVGRFAVERGGEQLDVGRLGSRKARLLLRVLAAARGRVMSMDRLVEALWGDDPPAKAASNVASLVSRIRGVLGAEAIDGGRAGYRIAAPAAARLDVDEAEVLVDQADAREASGQPALALTAATAALDLLGSGDVFEDEPAAEWAFDVGRETARLVRRARAVTWRSGLAVGDTRAALAVAQDAIAADALDEEAHRAVMLAHHRLDADGEALRSFSRLRTVLVEELGADPAPETRALHAAILRGDPIAADSLADGPEPPERPPNAARGTADVTSAGFVGRDEELGKLVDIWSTASQGVASCVLISGEAGIGKTRLASQLIEHIAAVGSIVVQARCYEAERSLFLQPIVEIGRAAVSGVAPELVRRALDEEAGPLAGLITELDHLLPPDGYEPASGEIERRRIFEKFASFLSGLARQRPLLVMLDDLHHAGASTLELLHFVLRRDGAAPLLVVATVRSDEPHDVSQQLAPLSTRIEVGPLPEPAIRALARTAGVADRATAVIDKTRGHTLFVVEALRALTDPSATGAGAENDPAGIPVPDSLLTTIQARVQRCGREVDELLRAAVVAGASWEISTLAALLSLDENAATQRAARAAHAGILVEQRTRYEFANDLIREVLYDSTPEPIRVMYHRRLATQLSDQPGTAAAHAAAAGDLDVAVPCWLEAGRRALEGFGHREAEHLFDRAADASTRLDDLPSNAAALLGRGRARVAAGRYEAAVGDFTTARQLARATGFPSTEAAALLELAWCLYYTRDLSRAGELALQAANHPAAGPRARVLLGRMRNTAGDLDGAVEVLEPLTTGDTDPAARASALSCLGTALAHSDRYGRAIDTLDDAVLACRHAGLLRDLLNAEMFGCYARANLGDLGGALSWADQLRADVEQFDAAATYLPRALNMLSWVWRELGDLPRSRDLAAEALERCRPDSGTAEGEPAANALLALAECALVDGDDVAASRLLGEIDPLLSDRVGYRWRIELRRLELATRIDRQRAAELLDMALRRRSPKYEALGLAHLGRHDEAVEAASRTGSSMIVGRVAPHPVARAALESLTGRLPAELREGFARRGLLARQLETPPSDR